MDVVAIATTGITLLAVVTVFFIKRCWSGTSRQRSLDELVKANLDTFDQATGVHDFNTIITTNNTITTTPKNTSPYSHSNPRTFQTTPDASQTCRHRGHHGKHQYASPGNKRPSFYDNFDSAGEDSDVDAQILVSNLKQGIYCSNEMLDRISDELDTSIKSLEQDFVTRSEDLYKALDKIDSLNIKEENKQFLMKKLNRKEDECHSALKALMKKRQEYNTGRIFNKASDWKPTGIVRSPPNHPNGEIIKGETVERYSSYNRGPLSPKERVLENIRNLRDDAVGDHVIPSKAKLPHYVPVEEERQVVRPRGIFTPKLLEKQSSSSALTASASVGGALVGGAAAPFSYMNTAKPQAQLQDIKLRKREEEKATNPVTSDNHPLTNGVKRGSVKNLAAIFDNSVSRSESPEKRLRYSAESVANSQDLTVSTKYGDGTDMDIDTSIMDESGSNVSMYCKDISIHRSDGGDIDAASSNDEESNSSLSRARSPVAMTKRFRDYKASKAASSRKAADKAEKHANGRESPRKGVRFEKTVSMSNPPIRYGDGMEMSYRTEDDKSDASEGNSSTNSFKENSSFNTVGNFYRPRETLSDMYFKSDKKDDDVGIKTKSTNNNLAVVSENPSDTSSMPMGIMEYQRLFSEKQGSRNKRLEAIRSKRTAAFRSQRLTKPLPTSTTTSPLTSSRDTGGLVTCPVVKRASETKPSGGGFLGLVNQVAPKNPVKRAHSVAAPGSAASKKAALLHWCQRMVEDKNIEIKNFSSSWNNGMAFCALFHHFIPDQIPYNTLNPSNREENFRIAFTEGEKAGVTALLDVEDMVMMKNPDWMSVMTYVSLIYNHFNGIRVGGPRLPPMPNQ